MRKGAGPLRALLRIVCFCCAVYVLWYAGDTIRHRLDSMALAGLAGQSREAGGTAPQEENPPAAGASIIAIPEQKDSFAAVPVDPEQAASSGKEPELLPRYAKLYGENQDLAGWLRIEGTDIDYPVMRSFDDEYYLSHNFQKQEDRYGSLFMRSCVNITDLGTNVIVYGHNMKDGSMFGNLDDYRDKSYWEAHPKILFDTLYEEQEYEVLGAFQARVLKPEEEGFRYYDFYEADSEDEFGAFYEAVKELSLYDTGVTAAYGDTFLTLSTCSYHTEDGRFVVVAKRIE